jgi:hypothetical protein
MSSVGPAEGISYEIISSSQITKPDAGRCGFNDLSIPNSATYTREVRQYTQYANGTVVRTWTETVDTFLACDNV